LGGEKERKIIFRSFPEVRPNVTTKKKSPGGGGTQPLGTFRGSQKWNKEVTVRRKWMTSP